VTKVSEAKVESYEDENENYNENIISFFIPHSSFLTTYDKETAIVRDCCCASDALLLAAR
jgi:hypothetical protein